METLLRPAKQLAEWDSTFAENLATYFDLLKQSQEVNFGEAALVIQSSTNVYARRVDYLWDETEALNRSLVAHKQHEGSTDTAKAKEKRSRKSKSVIDFNDFEVLELDNLIGKSNNLKKGNQKSLKLLTRRFTQLESNLAQLSSPIEILSTQGEVIGNKYDFRCNQQLTKNCLLVDELTPNDFSPAPTAATPNNGTHRTNVSSLNQDSGFESLFESTQLAATPESIASDDMETDGIPCADENLEKSTDIPDETDAGYTSGDAAEDHIEPETHRDATTEVPSTTGSQSETANVTVDTQAVEPIPFEQDVPEPRPRRRTYFKLPCHISLLKSKAESRKRKSMSVSKKRETLTRFFLDKYELLHKKLKTYSPTRQLFSPLKKEEFEELQKTLDQYLKSMQGSESCHYEAVTRGVAMELLGFQPNFTKHDPVVDNLPYAADSPEPDSTTIIDAESDLSSVPESFTTPPPTPEAANHRLSYRELVEQRMRQIGEEAAEQTDLEQRVADWHRSLRPKLIAAGRRPTFNIQEYSTRIIKDLEVEETKALPFGNLVKNKSAPEIARYFLASLQLANTYNVSINTGEDSGCGIELKLLDQDKRSQPLGLHGTIDRLPLSEASKDHAMLRISTT